MLFARNGLYHAFKMFFFFFQNPACWRFTYSRGYFQAVKHFFHVKNFHFHQNALLVPLTIVKKQSQPAIAKNEQLFGFSESRFFFTNYPVQESLYFRVLFISTHYWSMFPTHKNQPVDLHSKLIDWFLSEGNIDQEFENIHSCI